MHKYERQKTALSHQTDDKLLRPRGTMNEEQLTKETRQVTTATVLYKHENSL